MGRWRNRRRAGDRAEGSTVPASWLATCGPQTRQERSYRESDPTRLPKSPRPGNPPEFEPYDLENDPVEFHNLAGKPELREVQKSLTRALFEYRKQTNDPFLDAAFMEKIGRQALGNA